MSSGVSRTKTGAVYGTGVQLDVRIVGFKPRKVELYNQTGLAKAVWTDSMAEGLAMKTVTAGTISMTSAGEGITPLSDGFRLGVDADINAADELIHWAVHE